MGAVFTQNLLFNGVKVGVDTVSPTLPSPTRGEGDDFFWVIR